MFGRFKGGKRSRIIEAPPPPEAQLDLEGNFAIVVPIQFVIPVSPLETFSERAVKAYDIQQDAIRKHVRSSIFEPLPNGKLRVHPADKKEAKAN